jgi:hypothetical protein
MSLVFILQTFVGGLNAELSRHTPGRGVLSAIMWQLDDAVSLSLLSFVHERPGRWRVK